jgi:transcriptional regulator with XRE-family HTH domain
MSLDAWKLTADNARLVRESVATNLRRERERVGISHRTLATRSSVRTQTVAGIESSQREAKLSTLVALSFGLCVPTPVLLGGVPSPRACASGKASGATNAVVERTLPADSTQLIRTIVARNLRAERRRANMTQRTLALRSYVGEDTILRTEASKQEPKLITLVALSFGLSVPLVSLLKDVPSPLAEDRRRQSLTCT